MFTYKEIGSEVIEEVKLIYKKEEWNAYLNDDEKLMRAFDKSLYILGVFNEETLVGFIRCVGDGEHVLIVQDLIIDREYQKKGLGSKVFKMIMDKYCDVRMFLVITDIEDVVDNKFYQSFKFKEIKDRQMICYVR